MYLRQIRLTNIKGFREIDLSFNAQTPGQGGWYVLLGENGTGKSTLLRAIALALAGRERAAGLVPEARGWVTKGLPHGSCHAIVQLDNPAQPVDIRYDLNSLPFEDEEHGFVSRPSILFKKIFADVAKRLYSVDAGFLVAGYGPFRHLAESSPGRRAVRSEDPLASLFYPVPLTECEDWLKQWDYARKSSNDKDVDRAFTVVQEVLNQLLPRPFQLEDVGPEGVIFAGPGTPLSLSDLSDGYRTMFGLGVDLLRQWVDRVVPMANWRMKKNVDGTWSVDFPGVVLIDEPETHLHPKWQREIGFYLRRAFPGIQFIVATHSPFVAQAATPDGIFILRRDSDGAVTVDDTLDSLQGWRAEQILSSPAFGMETTRDVETEALMRRHEELRGRQLSGMDLTAEEKQELADLTGKLKHLLPSSARAQGGRTP